LSRGKNSPQHEFFVSFSLGKLRRIKSWENVTFANAEISTRTMSAPLGTFAAPSTHQDLGQGIGILFVFLSRL
jgi:hypothetical protein